MSRFDKWFNKYLNWILAAAIIFTMAGGLWIGQAKADHNVSMGDSMLISYLCPDEDSLTPSFFSYLKGKETTRRESEEANEAFFNGCMMVWPPERVVITGVMHRGIPVDGPEAFVAQVRYKDGTIGYVLMTAGAVLNHVGTEATQ